MLTVMQQVRALTLVRVQLHDAARLQRVDEVGVQPLRHRLHAGWPRLDLMQRIDRAWSVVCVCTQSLHECAQVHARTSRQ